MNINDVKKLNDEIESIQRRREKAQTQKEMLLNRSKDLILKYEKAYGVSLIGETIEDTFNSILAEKERVAKAIENEYELKTKVVTAINNGNIDEANRLLGLKNNDVVISEDVKDIKRTNDDTDMLSMVSNGDTSISINGEEEIDEGVTDANAFINDEYIDDSDDYPESEDYEEEGTNNGAVAVKHRGIELDVDLSDVDFGFDDSEESTSDVSEIQGTTDDSDDDFGYDDFGFAEILRGSKFEGK